MYGPHLYPFSCRWTFRFPCFGYCEQRCHEHRGTCIFLNYSFVQVYSQKWDCWVIGLKLNIQKKLRSWHLVNTSWQIDGGKKETVTDFISLDSKITVGSDYSHEIKRSLLLGRKAMTNLDSILKSRDITLPTKVHPVKPMVFPLSM